MYVSLQYDEIYALLMKIQVFLNRIILFRKTCESSSYGMKVKYI